MFKLFNIIVYSVVIYSMVECAFIVEIGTRHQDEVLLSSEHYSTPPTITPTNHTLLFKHLETARTTVWKFDMGDQTISGFDLVSYNLGPRINIRMSYTNVLQNNVLLSIYGFPPNVPLPVDFKQSEKITRFIDGKSMN